MEDAEKKGDDGRKLGLTKVRVWSWTFISDLNSVAVLSEIYSLPATHAPAPASAR